MGTGLHWVSESGAWGCLCWAQWLSYWNFQYKRHSNITGARYRGIWWDWQESWHCIKGGQQNEYLGRISHWGHTAVSPSAALARGIGRTYGIIGFHLRKLALVAVRAAGRQWLGLWQWRPRGRIKRLWAASGRRLWIVRRFRMPVIDGAETHCRCRLGKEKDFWVLHDTIWLVMSPWE